LKKITSTDPDILGSLPAMRRAMRRARQRAINTGTPLVMMRDGKITYVKVAKPGSTKSGRNKK
jgi:hypothetical protein